MNPQDPLASLHPLREPELIGWWPLAAGWWILLAIVLLALIAAGVYALKRYRANAYKRKALQQLELMWTLYQGNSDGARFLSDTNALLKSVALRSFGAPLVAAVSGQKWLDFLHLTMAGKARFADEFASAAYVDKLPALDMQHTYDTASTWIKLHRLQP